MPRLPTAEALGERPIARPDMGVVGYRPIADDSAGAAMVQAGKQVTALAEQMFQAKKAHDTIRAEDAVNKAKIYAQELEAGESGFSKLEGENAIRPNVIPDFEGKFKAGVAEIAGALDNEDQRKLFERAVAPTTFGYRGKLMGHVGKQAQRYDDDVFKHSIEIEARNAIQGWDNDNAYGSALLRIQDVVTRKAEREGWSPEQTANTRAKIQGEIGKGMVLQMEAAVDDAARLALQDPSQALAAFENHRAALERLQLAPDVKARAEDRARKAIINAGIAGWVNQNPDVASAMIESFITDPARDPKQTAFNVRLEGKKEVNVPFGLLDAAEQLKWRETARNVANQGVAVERQRVTSLLVDAETAARDGKTMLIPEDRFAVFGPDAGKAVERYRNSQALAGNIERVIALPVAERFALLAQQAPAEGAPGYADANRRASVLQRAIVEANRRQAEDPAAFTVASAPLTVGTALANFQRVTSSASTAQERQAAAQAFAEATIAEQHRLGSAPRTSNRLDPDVTILPRGVADAIVRQFNDDTQGGQPPAQLLQAQADMWGQYWPQVYSQIAKSLAPTARVIANLRDTPAAALLSSTSKAKTEELRGAIASTKATDIDDHVMLQLTEFQQSVTGWTTRGSQTYTDYSEAAKRLAYIYTAQGAEPVFAARRAVGELVYDYYDFHRAVRIPRGVDKNASVRGMDAILRNADSLVITVPADLALGQRFTREQVAASIKANGFFTATGDDSGVALWLEGRNGARAVEGPDGRPITFTWAELAERAAAALTQGQRLGFEETPAGAVTGIRRMPRNQGEQE